jgi:hypothetical protein
MGSRMKLVISRPRRWASARRHPQLLFALAFVACLYWTQLALAAVPSGLVVVPRPSSEPGLSYFKLRSQPGALERAGVIELRNPTPRLLRVVLAPVDSETLSTLGSAYAPPGSRPHGSTLWLQLAGRAVALSPGASVTVPISVLVPAGAQPGDYLSGVSVESLDQAAAKVKRHGVSIASVDRYAIGVETSLPGPRRPEIQFTGAAVERQPAGLTFLLRARNPGNVILQGVHGHVRITRAGHTVVSHPIEEGTFVAGTRIAYPVNAFGQTPTEGTHYRISAWMRYPGGIAQLDTPVTFGHRQAVIQQQYGRAPSGANGGTAWWKIAGVVAAILYGLATTILLLRRRTRAPHGIAE